MAVNCPNTLSVVNAVFSLSGCSATCPYPLLISRMEKRLAPAMVSSVFILQATQKLGSPFFFRKRTTGDDQGLFGSSITSCFSSVSSFPLVIPVVRSACVFTPLCEVGVIIRDRSFLLQVLPIHLVVPLIRPDAAFRSLRESESVFTDCSRSQQIRLIPVVLLKHDLPLFVGLFDRTKVTA